MDWSAITKYSGAAAMLGSIFWLVLQGKVDAHEYVTIVLGILTALGVYHATIANPTPTTEKTDEKVPPSLPSAPTP